MDTMDTTQEQNRFPQSPAPRSGNIGPLAAAVVIVLLLAAGGFYFFQSEQRKQANTEADQTAQTQGQPNVQDTSTDSIESDLNATQTAGAEADVSNLEQAL